MARLTKPERRARRRRILQAAVQLGQQLFPDDDEQRREWLAGFVAANVDIPGIGEAMEKRVIALVCELLEDIFNGDDNNG